MSIRLPTPGDSGVCGGACCITEPCSMTLTYVDENRCEDDAFDVMLLWTDDSGTQQSRDIGIIDGLSSPPGCCGSDMDGNPCPQTTVNIPLTVQPTEVGACCEIELLLTLDHTNCCGTWASFTITGPGGVVSSEYFDQGGLDQTFDIRQICNPAP